MGEWRSTKYPDGCTVCGTTTKTHIGRGLCSTCYQRDMKNDETSSNVGPVDSDERTPNLVDLGGHSGDFTENVERPVTSEERQPGSGGTSSVPPGPAAVRKKFWQRKTVTETTPVPVTNERRPGKKTPTKLGRRTSTADTLEDIIGGVGALAVRTGKHAPLGRYLQFSSAVNAEILDDAVAGTVIDRIALQPLVKGRGRFDALGSVFGPPAIILAIENDPSRAPVLIPVLKSTIRNSLPAMAKAMKKVAAKEKAQAEAAAELFPDLAPGEDPADAIIAMLFEGWTPPAPAAEPAAETEHEPQESAA
jgi:hypothetical protein